ncbi:hypothetical protein [Clostridium sp. HBUAS56017]|uniref:hypothetical protein n=1 Tax=Clostridium sp. HBUAS56017 TaxID=2571128 RepID=UPI001178436A|nr:hypothetical protein [Clostridium sp. HBUAS56017]
MDKPLIITLSFKTTSPKEVKLYNILFNLSDRGDELKAVLGEIYSPENYKKSYENSKAEIKEDQNFNLEKVDITNF